MDQLKLMGPVILNGILKSLDGSSNSDSGPFPEDIYIYFSVFYTVIYSAIGLESIILLIPIVT